MSEILPTTIFEGRVIINGNSHSYESGPERIHPKHHNCKCELPTTISLKDIERTDDGIWVLGRFFSDIDCEANGIEILILNNYLWEYRNFNLPLDCPITWVPKPFFTYDEKASYAKHSLKRFLYTLASSTPHKDPCPAGWAPCGLCGKPKPENESCQGRCAKWDPPWPTKNSRIGYLFYLGGMMCSQLLRKWLARSNSTRGRYTMKRELFGSVRP